MTLSIREALALGAVLMMAACIDEPGADVEGRTFVSTEVTEAGAPRELVEGTELVLTFEDGGVGAHAGCNSFGAEYALAGDTLVVTGGSTTEMGCDPALHEQDQWYFDLVMDGPTLLLDGDELVLSHDDVEITYLDEEVVHPDADLVGPLWTVDTIIDGETATSVGATGTLQLHEDGTVDIDSSCNAAVADFVADEQTITLTDLVIVTDAACEGAQDELEQAMLAVLQTSAPVTYEIDGDRLTLDAGEHGLGLTSGG